MSSDLYFTDHERELERRGMPYKYGLVNRYLHKFPFEDKEYLPNSYYYDSDYEDEGVIPDEICNLHETLKKFLKQVRESNGYDVDCCPPRCLGSPFIPEDPKAKHHSFYETMVDATNFALDKINAETGKSYVLIEVLKAVDTVCALFFLTLKVRDECDPQSRTIRALVGYPYSRSSGYTLEEWMFVQSPSDINYEMDAKKTKIGEGILNTLEKSAFEHILSFLDDKSAVALASTCRAFRSVSASFRNPKLSSDVTPASNSC